MNEVQVTFTDEERQYLTDLLKNTIKDMLVEEHRTRAPSYREPLIHRESVAKNVLNKLQQVSG